MRLTAIGCLFGLVAGCAAHLVGTQAWFENSGREELSKRAAFDLSCPADKLQFAGLGAQGNYESVGVNGCEKKAAYVYVEGKWVLNADTH